MIKNSILYLIMISLILIVGFVQSWNVALLILNMCIISSIMSLGVNIQYGYAGLFNLGIMGVSAMLPTMIHFMMFLKSFFYSIIDNQNRSIHL